MTIEWDENALERLGEEVAAKLQPQVDEFVRATIIEVRDEYDRQPADVVYAELDRRIRTGLGPGTVPNEAELRSVAGKIEAGTLADW